MNVIIATRNAHKAHEIQAIVGNGFKVLTLKDIGHHAEIIEDGDTFEENAKIKVQDLAKFIQANEENSAQETMLLADDSGLEVDFLKGEPGVRSARYAGEASNDSKNTQKLLKNLEGIPATKRIARFRCVLAAARWPFEKIEIFDGACEGKIGFKPKGDQGFGYDPVFFPEGFCRTFAELTSEEKNEISHRAKAMAKFKAWLVQLG